MYTSIHRSRRTSVAVLTTFFCRIPAVWRKVRVGLLAEVGLAPQARPREQPGRLRRVAQVSLRRLAPALQACLLFSPTGLKRTVENLGDVFLALYMFSASFIFQDLRISDAGGFLVRRDPSFRACCACSPLGRTKRVAALAGAPGAIL